MFDQTLTYQYFVKEDAQSLMGNSQVNQAPADQFYPQQVNPAVSVRRSEFAWPSDLLCG